MNEIDLDALEAVAKAATPGPWEAETWVHPFQDDITFGLVLTGSGGELWDTSGGNSVADARDAEHIAAFNPSTVLQLIARVRDAEAIVEAIRGYAQRTVDSANALKPMVTPYPAGMVDGMHRAATVVLELITNHENGSR